MQCSFSKTRKSTFPAFSLQGGFDDEGLRFSGLDVSHGAFTFFPQEFEDLDEIVARYVQPMASFARDLLNHKYYQDCSGGDRKVSLEPSEEG